MSFVHGKHTKPSIWLLVAVIVLEVCLVFRAMIMGQFQATVHARHKQSLAAPSTEAMASWCDIRAAHSPQELGRFWCARRWGGGACGQRCKEVQREVTEIKAFDQRHAKVVDIKWNGDRRILDSVHLTTRTAAPKY